MKNNKIGEGIDVNNDCSKTVEILGGELVTIKPNSSTFINPFEVEETDLTYLDKEEVIKDLVKQYTVLANREGNEFLVNIEICLAKILFYLILEIDKDGNIESIMNIESFEDALDKLPSSHTAVIEYERINCLLTKSTKIAVFSSILDNLYKLKNKTDR